MGPDRLSPAQPTLPQNQPIPKQNPTQIRGKAIALHSQAITEFCYFVGAQVRRQQMNVYADHVLMFVHDFGRVSLCV